MACADGYYEGYEKTYGREEEEPYIYAGEKEGVPYD